MQNILAAVFEIESEGYQALTTLSKSPVTDKATILQMALIKREAQTITICDSFNSGIHTNDDTLIGGLLGGLLGVLGGPIGVLLMGSYGALAGSVVDAGDALEDTSLMEAVAAKLQEGTVALIALVDEEDESILDGKLSSFKTEILRFDAAAIAEQVEEAQQMQREMSRQARMQLRESRKADFQKKVEEKRAKLSADFAEFKAKFKRKQ